VPLSLILIALMISALGTDAVETSFSRFFRYERTTETGLDAAVVPATNATSNVPPPFPTAKPSSSPSRQTPSYSSAVRRDSYGSLSAMMRWNTFSLVSDFGMESGARVEIVITNLTYTVFPAIYSSRHVPVVFTLYDTDQWRAYSVLRMRDMPLKSPTLLCHYPAAMRYTLTERNFHGRRDPLTGAVRVVFDVKRPSLYTLQVQVCGDASVYVAGHVKMVNRGFDNSLSQHLAVEEFGLIALYQGSESILRGVLSLGTNLCWCCDQASSSSTVSSHLCGSLKGIFAARPSRYLVCPRKPRFVDCSNWSDFMGPETRPCISGGAARENSGSLRQGEFPSRHFAWREVIKVH
jgi:hypothetical protein